MSEDTRADCEFNTYTLAINDMEHVEAVARLIADHDPLFNPLGPTVAVPHGLHRKQMTALLRRADASRALSMTTVCGPSSKPG
jgi:hypothetical protein